MLLKNASVGGEFYVAPVFNEFILAGQTRRVSSRSPPSEMHGLGTPEEVERFQARAYVAAALRLMLNIVLPIAGRGSRFADAGYELPKPLIPVHGVPDDRDRRAQRAPGRAASLHLRRARRASPAPGHARRRSSAPRQAAIVVPVDQVTEGAACTVLLAREHIDTDEPLMLANSDQWVDVDIDDYLAAMDRQPGRRPDHDDDGRRPEVVVRRSRSGAGW